MSKQVIDKGNNIIISKIKNIIVNEEHDTHILNIVCERQEALVYDIVYCELARNEEINSNICYIYNLFLGCDPIL